MNIFYLSNNPKKAAQYHNDKHVVKMILESAQLLSTAHHLLDVTPKIPNLYKPTHKNHPCSLWVRNSINNYMWLYNLFCNLCDEYTFRYGKIHKTDMKLRKLLNNAPTKIPHVGFTQPPQAMPDDVKTKSSCAAYRKYYSKYKKHIASWTKREVPEWFK